MVKFSLICLIKIFYMFKKVIILLVAVFLASAKLGIDVSQPHSEDVLKCFVK